MGVENKVSRGEIRAKDIFLIKQALSATQESRCLKVFLGGIYIRIWLYSPFCGGIRTDALEGVIRVVKVNGEVFSNEPFLSSSPMIIRDSAQVVENTISMVWYIGESRVWEKFYTLDEDSIRKFIYIEMVFYNADPVSTATVGFLQFLDIKIGDNDNPTVLIPGETFQGIERRFILSQMPAYWTLFSDYGDTNSFLGQGVPIGRDEIYADLLIFSDVSYIDTVHWDYVALVRPVDDLGMLIRWNEQDVEAYEFYIVGYYYGLGYPDAEIREIAQKLHPAKLIIGSPYPNPTNGGTSIKVQVLDYPQNISADIFALDGRFVKNIYKGKAEVGEHNLHWDLTDDSGKPVNSGVYVVRVSYGKGRALTQKVVVIK